MERKRGRDPEDAGDASPVDQDERNEQRSEGPRHRVHQVLVEEVAEPSGRDEACAQRPARHERQRHEHRRHDHEQRHDVPAHSLGHHALGVVPVDPGGRVLVVLAPDAHGRGLGAVATVEHAEAGRDRRQHRDREAQRHDPSRRSLAHSPIPSCVVFPASSCSSYADSFGATLRAHAATRNCRKGSSPIGRGFALINTELDKNIYDAGFLRIKAGPFLDAGRAYDASPALGSGMWLVDAGVQLKLTVFGAAGVTLSYGRGLRDGRSALYASPIR
jgi:hypothetical protein